MSDLFDSILNSEESLFLNPQFLDTDYQPKLIPFRENQQKHIVTCIKPLLQRRNGKNIIVFGKPGIGKTVCLKHVLNELKEDYSDEVHCLYINCWKKDTPFKVITTICEQLNYKWIHNKTFEDLMKYASEIVNEKSAVIVLDEVDKLQDENVLYSILEDFYKTCLILITNDSNFIAKLDSRVRSRLLPELLEFKPYNENETEEILKQRVKYAFVPNILQKEAFNIIINKTFEVEDIRVGLFLLKQSGENAENKSSKQINTEHVDEALSNLAINGLGGNDEELLSIIKENSGKPTSEIFKIYKQKEGKSMRTFQRKLKELEKNNKIKLKNNNNGFNGRQVIIEHNEND